MTHMPLIPMNLHTSAIWCSAALLRLQSVVIVSEDNGSMRADMMQYLPAVV